MSKELAAFFFVALSAATVVLRFAHWLKHLADACPCGEGWS